MADVIFKKRKKARVLRSPIELPEINHHLKPKRIKLSSRNRSRQGLPSRENIRLLLKGPIQTRDGCRGPRFPEQWEDFFTPQELQKASDSVWDLKKKLKQMEKHNMKLKTQATRLAKKLKKEKGLVNDVLDTMNNSDEQTHGLQLQRVIKDLTFQNVNLGHKADMIVMEMAAVNKETLDLRETDKFMTVWDMKEQIACQQTEIRASKAKIAKYLRRQKKIQKELMKYDETIRAKAYLRQLKVSLERAKEITNCSVEKEARSSIRVRELECRLNASVEKVEKTENKLQKLWTKVMRFEEEIQNQWQYDPYKVLSEDEPDEDSMARQINFFKRVLGEVRVEGRMLVGEAGVEFTDKIMELLETCMDLDGVRPIEELSWDTKAYLDDIFNVDELAEKAGKEKE